MWVSEEQPQKSLQSDSDHEHGFIYAGWELLDIMCAERWKIVWDSWRNGHQAKEILAGDEFTVKFWMYCVAF